MDNGKYREDRNVPGRTHPALQRLHLPGGRYRKGPGLVPPLHPCPERAGRPPDPALPAPDAPLQELSSEDRGSLRRTASSRGDHDPAAAETPRTGAAHGSGCGRLAALSLITPEKLPHSVFSRVNSPVKPNVKVL